MTKFYNFILLFCVTSLFVMGLVMIFNTTSAEILDHSLIRSTHQALLKQLLYASMGFVIVGGVWVAGYRRLIDWSPPLLIFFTILLVLTLIPGIGREVNGSRRWIGIAGFSFQPSEFVKYLVPAFITYQLKDEGGAHLSFKGFLRIVGYVSIPIVLILVEPNNGTAGVIGLTALVMCIITRVRFKYWAIPLLVFSLVGAISAYNLPYVTARLNVYLHPELDLKGKGHQPYQAKIAAGSGEFWGRGPGNSLQKLSYLPEAQNDYIAAIFAEEFGFFGIVCLISLYMLIGFLGFTIALVTPFREGFYLSTAIIFLFCFQAFMNLGVVSGLLPSTGLNLPFFSQGGTSLMANMMGIALLLNISQDKNELYAAS